MEKKYMLTDETKVIDGRILHRIKALRDFGDVEAGTIGGFIEKEKNLSQGREAWVNENACVFGDARISDNAQIFGNALIYGNAVVCGDAFIFDEAQVYGSARIYDDTRISGNAQVYGYAQTYDNVEIYDNAQIYDNAWASDNVLICGNARICDNARICGKATVCGYAEVYDNALIEGMAWVKTSQVCGCSHVAGTAVITDGGKVSQDQHVCNGVVKTDLSKNLAASIRAQCNLPVINNKVIAYKLVRPDFTSFYDVNFKYEVGKIIEAESYDLTLQSCAAGLHFSNLTYWERAIRGDFVCLEAEIDLGDVITVQEGKIRCKRAKILRAFTFD